MARLIGLGKPDNKGRHTRDLGWELASDGRLRQHRFLLGKERGAAEHRYTVLGKIWEAVEKRWNLDGRKTAKPLWDSVSLKIAMAVARGEDKVTFPSWELAHLIPDGVSYADDSKALYKVVTGLQKDFFLVNIELLEEEIVADGRDETVRERDKLDSLLRLKRSCSTLFMALDVWAETQVRKYVDSEHGQKQKDRVKFLKRHVQDMPLHQLGNSQIEEIREIIASRPIAKSRGRKDKPCSKDYAHSLVKVLNAFLDWLDGADLGWQKPRGYVKKPVRLRRLDEERVMRTARVPVYNKEELTLLYKYATPLERVYLLLALNCAFGAGELETLWMEEIKLDTAHEEYGIPGSYIMRERNKSYAYGEWRLWPETVAGIKWYQAHHNKKESGHFVLVKGKPIAFTAGGNRSKYFANTMLRIIKRVKKDYPEFRRLSFNKLKKSSATLVRRLSHSSEVASVHTSHGEVCDDMLLRRYANFDFRKVFKAQKRLRKFLAEMFQEVAEPFPEEVRKHNPSISLETIRRIKEMRKAGVSYADIKQRLSVSFDTIRRYSRKDQGQK